MTPSLDAGRQSFCRNTFSARCPSCGRSARSVTKDDDQHPEHQDGGDDQQDGHHVGPCLLWLDSRGRPHAARRVGGPVSGYHPAHLAVWVRRTGGAPAADGADPLGHRWYLQAEQPPVYDLYRSQRRMFARLNHPSS
jgi:hypothetical protein